MVNTIVTKAEDLVGAEFPLGSARSEQMRFLLNFAIMAPSIYNTQPWQFDLSEGTVRLYADRTRLMTVRDPNSRQLLISCGAALFYLRLAARHFGCEIRIAIFPDNTASDLLAHIELLGPAEAAAECDHLFRAIPMRRTNRSDYERRAVAGEVIQSLVRAAEDEECHLSVVSSTEAMRSIAELVAEADAIQWSDRRFRSELASWLHPNIGVSYDGVQSDAFGLDGHKSYEIPALVRSRNLGSQYAARDTELIQNTSALAVLATDSDTRKDWLSAGQALASLLLHATASGVSASFINQPVEAAAIRPRLADLCCQRYFPQLVLRIGYAPLAPATLRRSISSVQV